MPNKKHSILIVEDDISLRIVLKEKFKNSGFEVFEAVDGVEGLKLSLEKQPDMILLDIIMPNMDGITMLKRLRVDERGRDLPVIILSNLNDAESTSKAMEGGAFDYLVKTDWKLDDLIKKVNDRLKNPNNIKSKK